MRIDTIEGKQGETVACIIAEGETLFADEQSALDLIATVHYEHGSAKMVLRREDIAPEFFDLKTRLAGGILQKFVNYHASFAIVGDFENEQSKSLRDFIFESNRGKTAFFVGTEEEARELLGRA